MSLPRPEFSTAQCFIPLPFAFHHLILCWSSVTVAHREQNQAMRKSEKRYSCEKKTQWFQNGDTFWLEGRHDIPS